jgi:2-C-methyl-D-erythritol 4-phosphate cytidylyltransferase
MAASPADPERTPSAIGATAILLAAGRSERMADAAGERKPFLELAGTTVLERACAAFEAAARIDGVVLVVHADDLVRTRALASGRAAFGKLRAVVEGGAQRTDSVRLGLAAALALGVPPELVAVHDVARALVRPETIDAAVEHAARHGACVLAVPVTDTIKTSSDGRHSERTLDRSVLWRAQTPQVFSAARLAELCRRAQEDGLVATDDAALFEEYVGPVPMLRGDEGNLKLTTPTDLATAEALLAARERAAGAGRAGDRTGDRSGDRRGGGA